MTIQSHDTDTTTHGTDMTNNDVLDVLYRINATMGGSLRRIETQLSELARQQPTAQRRTGIYPAYINDIADVLQRVAALETHMPVATDEERYELHMLLQKMVDWAVQAAKTVNVPLKLP